MRVEAAGVADFNAHVRAHEPGVEPYVAEFRTRGPVLTGIDLAGVVLTDGTVLSAGDRIFGYVHLLHGPRTHTRYVAVRESDLARLPDEILLADAAALPCSGLAAIEVVEHVAR